MQIPLMVGLNQIKPDSAKLIWPDQTFQSLQLQPGKTQKLIYQNGLPKYSFEKILAQQQKLLSPL